MPECLQLSYKTEQWLSQAVQEVTVDFGKSPLEQLFHYNEFGRGVFFICLAEVVVIQLANAGWCCTHQEKNILT